MTVALRLRAVRVTVLRLYLYDSTTDVYLCVYW